MTLQIVLLSLGLVVVSAALWYVGFALPGAPSAAKTEGNAPSPTTQVASAQETPEPTATPEPTYPPPPPATLSILLPGEMPAGLDGVLSAFEQQTRDSLNLTLNFTFVTRSRYTEALVKALAENKPYDIVYDAPGIGLNTRLAQGAYHDVKPLLDSGAYPALQEILTEEVLRNNQLNGKNYTVPLVRERAEVYGIALRDDLRKSYKLDEINSMDGLEAYFAAAKSDKKSRPPLLVNGIEEGRLLAFDREFREKRIAKNVYSVPLSEYIWADVLLSADKTKVEAAAVADFQGGGLKAFPEAYSYTEKSDASVAARWTKSGYLTTRSVSETNKWEAFYRGETAAITLPLSEYAMVARTMKLRQPESEIEFFVPDDSVRASQPGTLPSDGRALHNLGVLVTSGQASRALAFLNWLWTDQANHDLFAYGIQGTDWEESGGDGWKRPEGKDESMAYFLSEWSLTRNPKFGRTREGMPESVKSASAFARTPESVQSSPFLGMAFDSSPYFDLVYRIGPSTRYALTTVQLAQVVADFDRVTARVDQKYREMGNREELRAEIVRQAQAYLDRPRK